MTDIVLPLLIAVPILAAVGPLLLSLRTTETGWYVASVACAAEVALAGVLVKSVYAEAMKKRKTAVWKRFTPMTFLTRLALAIIM